MLLLVLRAREREGHRRKAAEGRYRRPRTSLQIGGERRSSLVGSTELRVGRCEEGVRKEVLGIGVERADQRVDGLLVPPEKDERVPSTVPPPFRL